MQTNWRINRLLKYVTFIRIIQIHHVASTKEVIVSCQRLPRKMTPTRIVIVGFMSWTMAIRV